MSCGPVGIKPVFEYACSKISNIKKSEQKKILKRKNKYT